MRWAGQWRRWVKRKQTGEGDREREREGMYVEWLRGSAGIETKGRNSANG